ncbi:MAG TPA: glycoside hydrolase 43 family protein [Clostridium sp.]|nr:glycoside hydrolase 43 family protein [Clostridium sp.]
MAKFKNPILRGFYPDPSICAVGEDFYLVNSTFAYFPGVPIFHSKDLANWEQIGSVFTRSSQLNLGEIGHSAGVYAPTIRYNKGKFYLITTNIPHYGNFIVTADDPKGPWSDPYILKGAQGIDPSLFFDEDGKSYYIGTRDRSEGPKYYGDNEIYVQEIDLENMKLIGESHAIWNGALRDSVWAEGAHLYKKDGYYYLMIAEGGTAYEHSVMIARSKTLFGKYEGCKANPILTHRHLGNKYPIQYIGHADLVKANDDEWYMVMLGVRKCQEHCNTGRETFLAKVTWQDGWPVVNEGIGKIELEGETTLEEHRFEDKEKCFHFYGKKLDNRFLRLRNPYENMYSLDEREGFLRLKLSQYTLSDLCSPSYLGIRQDSYDYILSTMMEFEPKSNNESAGLAILQSNEYHLRYEYIKENDENILRVVSVKDSKDEIMAQINIASDRLFLKVIGRNQKLNFYYSLDGEEYAVLAVDIDSRFLSTESAGGFVGCTLGMFASSNGNESTNHVDFLYLNYSRL